jgi:hypothetical protein
MKHKKMLTILLLAIVLTIWVGAVLNGAVRSLNQGMPVIGCIVAFGKYVPINQETKLVFLADVIPIGNYVLSVGDLFFITGMFTCLIALWFALPQGRKYFPFLIVSIIGIFLNVAQTNQIQPLVLCEIASILSVLAIYYSYRSSGTEKAVNQTQPIKSMSNVEYQDVSCNEMVCLCREGIKQCSWCITRDFSGQLKSYCANPNIPIQAKIICGGNQPQLSTSGKRGP